MTHAPEQTLSPPAQLQLFPPPLQQTPLLQLPHPPLPHAPQLFLSVSRLLHAVPHCVVVDPEQERPQTPPEQVAEPVPEVGPLQAWPHEPQLLVSVLSLTQTPLQSAFPEGHWHTPLVHVPPEHVIPHPPQLLLSVNVLVHAPLQTFCPAAQQTLDTHDLPAPQAFPQAPQLLLSLVVSTHAPPHWVGVLP